MVETAASTSKQPRKEQNSRRNSPRNVLHKLHIRETRGCLRVHEYGTCLDLLPKVPPRLRFRLRNIVQESTAFGHVFFGFTKDGQHLLSYSMQMDVYLPPTFAYHLCWWRFKPHHPLRKVAEVKLFGEVDIPSELLISVCQWPSDDSKIVIYGISHESRGHQSPCYLTIAANPPLDPCNDCKHSAKRLDQDGSDDYDEVDGDQFPLCLRHGFVLHLQFSLVPPFPEFNPLVSLKKDGQVIINTGDSIVAVNVMTEDKCVGSENGSFLITSETDAEASASLEGAHECLEPILTRKVEESDKKVSSVGLEEEDRKYFKIPSLFNVPSSSDFLPVSVNVTAEDGDSVHTSASQPSSIVELFTSPFCHRHKDRTCSKTESKEEEKLEGAVMRSCDGAASFFEDMQDLNVDCIDLELRAFQGSNVSSKTISKSDIDTKTDSKSKHSESTITSSPSSPSVSSGMATNIEVRTYSHKQIEECGVPRIVDVGRVGVCGFRLRDDKESTKENVSPDCDYKSTREPWTKNIEDGTSKRVHSDVGLLSPLLAPPSSPDHVQQPSCVVRVKRVFVPHRDESLEENEEDDFGNLVYNGSLPLEVQWPSGTALSPCPRSLLAEVTGPTLVVKQVIFDVERYLDEMAQRLCTEAGKKFLAFDDYDIEIVDVLSETSDVIVLAMMIVQATPKNKGLTKSERNISSVIRKQYETGFTFVWSVETGKYKVVGTETLTEVDVSKVKHGLQRTWNPGKKQCAEFQEKMWLLPRSRLEEVTVLTNEPVFTGDSLDEIVSPSGDVIITR